MSSRARRTEHSLLLVILLLAAMLRFYHLDHSSLWSDEGNTWALLSRSFSQIAHDAAADIHPPGYYWLLKLWTAVFGSSAWGMRSFSALLGVLLVYLIYRIGLLIGPLSTNPQHIANRLYPLLATLLAAINPFQIYYSQEARMYMLLAVAGAGLMWSLLGYIHAIVSDHPNRIGLALTGYVLFGTLGLWTHYSFPIILLAAGVGILVGAWHAMSLRSVMWFGVANIVVFLCYLPWLPTAVNRVLAWPAGGATVSWLAGAQMTLQTLLIGPLDQPPAPSWVWLLCAAWLPLLGTMLLYWRSATDHRSKLLFISTTLVLLWWLLPIGLMFGAGLFTDAFLKFLLTASPAWLLLTAATVSGLSHRRGETRFLALVLSGGGVTLALFTLPHYYNNPTVRDNYAGVAAYVAAVADPAQDLVILDAPGQQEVWSYYDPDIPVLALPATRPPDPAATVATLQQATTDRHHLFALFWATDEADPERLVETWLDQHAFKGLESWQGNLRFVLYTLSDAMTCAAPEPPPRWGELITLEQRCFPSDQTTVHAGEVALVSLDWQTDAPITTRYKVTVQLLNAQNQVIAQRDSEPVGGSRPTDSWQPHETIRDKHGVWIPVGTPPGTYRMIVALYDESGARLSVGNADHWVIAELTVSLPEEPFPVALLPIQHWLHRQLGPVTLIGYNAYRQGMAHAPETPLQPNVPVEFTFFWQAPSPLPVSWPAELTATLTLGTQQVAFPLAGETYPTKAWRAGQLLQYGVTVPFDGTDRYPTVQIGDQTAILQPLPVP
ncbi:MAG: glycosyltransferase family 39 protein [Caldilineaceae bacterium]|nr:glycosyltransferase family 39 protein [Caldilineaceae bacterium]